MVKMRIFSAKIGSFLVRELLTLPMLSILLLNDIGVANAQQSPPTLSPNPGIQPTPPLSPSSSPPPPRPRLPSVDSWGNQIILNGRNLTAAWAQRRGTNNSITTHISDGALRQIVGVDLLDTNNPNRQPVQWFSPNTKPIVLPARIASGYRYLDVTSLTKTGGWLLQVQGNILVISTPETKVTNIRQEKQEFVERAYIDLDKPAPWQIRQEPPARRVVDPDAINPQPIAPSNREWTITIDGIADYALIQRYNRIAPPPTAPALPNLLKQLAPLIPIPPAPATPAPTPEPLIKQIEVVNNQTAIRVSVPFGFAPRISTTQNSLIIEVRPDALVERNITWTPGVNWRQRYVNLSFNNVDNSVTTERFPVVFLEINPRTPGLRVRPFTVEPTIMTGTASLIQMASQYLAVAAINGGFFNRNNRLPLGAIRREGQWLSGPILNRGAIGWNDSGQFFLGRLTLQESVTTGNQQYSIYIPIIAVNSGFVQSGISRYTPNWGQTYTPLTDNEIIVVVQRNQVVNQLQAGKANQIPIPIPSDGYLLTLRGNASSYLTQFPNSTQVRINSTSVPPEFNRFPNIMAAGPLLVQNRQVVLDAKAEGFSNAFIAEKAIRSAICTTATGNLLIAAVHNRAGGAGPNLAEHAQIMQQIGCVNALNLDGGSSTGIYLGGQIIDRSANTAARVHNGIGVFTRE